MWEIEGRSAKDIAKELGIKQGSVRHTVSRARSSMRRILSEYIIDEKRGLTALDLLSTTYQRSTDLARKSSKAALALFLLFFAYLGFTNLNDSPNLLISVKPETLVGKVDLDSTPTIPQSTVSKKPSSETFSKTSSTTIVNARATSLSFPGLDKFGIPTSFSVTDSTGSLGTLYFSGKEASMSETGMTIASLVKTSSGAANIFLNQAIVQDNFGASYEAILSFGRKGAWVPLVTRVISIDTERLMSGNYVLTVVIQVKSEVETPIVIPASSDGRDLEVAPSRVITRILLNSTKTQILAQAVQVVEKVSR
jgi:hypothetical protein